MATSSFVGEIIRGRDMFDVVTNLINDGQLPDVTDKEKCLSFVTTKRNCKRLRLLLEALECFDQSKPVMHLDDSRVALAVKPKDSVTLKTWLLETLNCSETKEALQILGVQIYILSFPDKRTSSTQSLKLKTALRELITRNGFVWSSDFETTIPKNWERHEDMIILPLDSFHHSIWKDIPGADLWKAVAGALSANRVAVKNKIKNDSFRSSQVRLVLGNDPFVTHTDNGIKYTFDVTKLMFSAGNINEKLRVGSFDCREQTVVDMFAGIGYFALPYLVHAKCKLLHACEWNPDAVKTLERNLRLNDVYDKCIIHFGDNRKEAPIGVAQHVNLGLIPSSEESWEAGCRALDPSTGGILHIHGNVESSGRWSDHCADQQKVHEQTVPTLHRDQRKLKPAWSRYGQYVSRRIADVFREIDSALWSTHVQYIGCVKSYAPHVDHLVIDVQCQPCSQDQVT